MSSKSRGWLSPALADFAPSLLAIQQSPPPRLPRAVFHTVGALFALLVAWASLARLDIVAVAEGRLVPETYTKILQPAEPGIVKDVLVSEGDEVATGQVLIRLDATLAGADSETVATELTLKRLALRRIDAELAGVSLVPEAQDDLRLLSQVQTQAQAHRQSYLDALAQETAALERALRDAQAVEATVSKLRDTSVIAQQSADAHRRLVAEGFYSAVAFNEREKEAIEQRQDLKAQLATLKGLQATIAAQQKKIAAMSSHYRHQLHAERTEVIGQLAKLEQDSRKSTFRSGLLELRAPQAGVVKDIATTSRGAVVQAGMVLLTLVPKEERLVAEVQVRNDDVAFVQRGQAVRLKVAAYPFQKYGLLEGKVKTIAADAQSAESSPRQSAPQGYKATVTLLPQSFAAAHDKPRRLEAGMLVSAEIHQGRRSAMEYLLSPVQRTLHDAARER